MNIPQLINFALGSKELMAYIKNEYDKQKQNHQHNKKTCVINEKDGKIDKDCYYVGETDKTIVVKKYILLDKRTHKIL